MVKEALFETMQQFTSLPIQVYKNIYSAFLHCFCAGGHSDFKHLSITHINVRVIIQTPHPGIRSFKGHVFLFVCEIELVLTQNNFVLSWEVGPNE